jgi:hypothetical protein
MTRDLLTGSQQLSSHLVCDNPAEGMSSYQIGAVWLHDANFLQDTRG